jgi:hypothetical protein
MVFASMFSILGESFSAINMGLCYYALLWLLWRRRVVDLFFLVFVFLVGRVIIWMTNNTIRLLRIVIVFNIIN